MIGDDTSRDSLLLATEQYVEWVRTCVSHELVSRIKILREHLGGDDPALVVEYQGSLLPVLHLSPKIPRRGDWENSLVVFGDSRFAYCDASSIVEGRRSLTDVRFVNRREAVWEDCTALGLQPISPLRKFAELPPFVRWPFDGSTLPE
jgi:hypothetical protein